MRKYIIIFTILLLPVISIGLAGCFWNKEPNGNKEPEYVILEGKNLEELGLELDIDKLKCFTDEFGLTTRYLINHYKEGNVYPGMSGLLVAWAGHESELLLFIQGFIKTGETGLEQRIVVDSKEYPLAELEEYKLYEDSQVVVYDVTALVPRKSYTDQVQEWIDKGIPCEWMYEVYDYIMTYEDIDFKRVQGN
ncbi:MAG: hypothetical protein PHS56_02940 [Eubacteriales bacterium]|nr:hypothetical protein [Eubacteriales bacterium]MDD4768621.1 hypothetical protein [Eubacteriales bacterium]